MGCPDNARLGRQEKTSQGVKRTDPKYLNVSHDKLKKKKEEEGRHNSLNVSFLTTEVKKEERRRALLGSGQELTGVEDGGVDPALSVADGHFALGVAEQDICAASPGGRRHSVGVVASPVPHQHAVIIIMGIQLSTTEKGF